MKRVVGGTGSRMKFPRERRNAWRSLIAKAGMKPVAKVIRKSPDTGQGKPWRPDPEAERKFPVSESKTGRTIVFDSREQALVFIQWCIDQSFSEWWDEMTPKEDDE